MNVIRTAETDADIARCFPVMSQLRPHLTADQFVAQVQRQRAVDRFHLAYLAALDIVRAVAGFRFGECLAWGRFLYVDDLVTDSTVRSQGFGGELFDWLVKQAADDGCDQLHLDSGVQRFDAHRFYLGKRMAITCHHFTIKFT